MPIPTIAQETTGSPLQTRLGTNRVTNKLTAEKTSRQAVMITGTP